MTPNDAEHKTSSVKQNKHLLKDNTRKQRRTRFVEIESIGDSFSSDSSDTNQRVTIVKATHFHTYTRCRRQYIFHLPYFYKCKRCPKL